MKPWQKTLIFVVIIALEIAFIAWTRWAYLHNFVGTLG